MASAGAPPIKTLAWAFVMIGGTTTYAHAQQRPVTAFDGKYLGVEMISTCAAPAPNRPLTIMAGAAEYNGGLAGELHYRGTMTANGYAMLRDESGRIINLKIEPNGRALGVIGAAYCTVTRVWQKQG